ncbi:hypothetical protein ACFW6S_31700 [Streptomyces sp. NPDC058740]|uniref:hypothetical protein n=1 Tax=Streptomyces sp. NPDC058740 TaxID=3346619 RepID=UPI0036A26CF6
MSTPMRPDGFSTLQDAADAIVDEILRRRIDAAAARRQDKRLRWSQPGNPWFGHPHEMPRTDAAVEERALFLALFHVLGGEDADAETFFRDSVQERYVEQPDPGDVALSREAQALKPT